MQTADRTMEDARLVARMAAGDQAALGRLVERHGRGLTVLATRFLGDAADAEEIVQDVFVTAWRNAGRYDPARAAVSTWLYRIATSRCIDRHRRRALRTAIGLDDLPAEPADPAPDPAAVADGRARLALVRRRIGALPARQRMALLLSVVAELGAEDVAAAMGTSRGAVEQLLVRARRTLRAALDDPDPTGRVRKEET